jgi:hypothetical protein
MKSLARLIAIGLCCLLVTWCVYQFARSAHPIHAVGAIVWWAYAVLQVMALAGINVVSERE